MAVVAATQGFAVANGAYQSTIVQDALATGSIPHKMIYAVVMGGGGYSEVLRQPTRVSYPDRTYLTFHKV